MQLKIWSAETGQCAANLIGHRAGTTQSSFAVAETSRHVLSATEAEFIQSALVMQMKFCLPLKPSQTQALWKEEEMWFRFQKMELPNCGMWATKRVWLLSRKLVVK